MGMGHAGGYADVIEDKSIKKFCKKEFGIFKSLFGQENDVDFEDFARAAAVSGLDEKDSDGNRMYPENVVEAYEDLQEAFEQKTGLTLYLGFHNSDDEGDRYDEVDGAFWCVGNMYELTPAGQKMEKFVERKSFVQFG